MPVAKTIRIALLLVGITALAVALWDVTMGGFHLTVGGLRVSSREAYKPFRLGMLAMIARLWLNDHSAESTATSWHVLPRWTALVAAVVALISIAVAIRYGVFVAGGADAYGYVSQASLWANGGPVAPNPLAALEPALGAATVPLGYRLAQTPGAIVPMYAAGFPLAMALALEIGGANAVYYVVPILGGLTVWLTYVLGARVDRPATGMMAAILVAFSPIFMFQTLEPMSDVPVTAWWMLAWVLALSPARLAALGSGLAVSAAVLTRPNLVPLAIVLVVVVAAMTPRPRRVALFAAGSIPGCLIVAAINARLYGSPLAAGYGPFAMLYGWRHWRLNLQHYTRWLTELNSPGILLAFLAPVAVRVRQRAAMLVFVVILFACYLWYTPFDTWPFLRFLMPAIPILFILASAVVVRAVEMLPLGFRTAAVFVVCTLMPTWYVTKSRSLTVFTIRRAEHRYATIGEYLGRTLPAKAIVLTMIESGSIRVYGARATLRWDMLEPDRLDAAVDTVRAAGYYPYLLLEDWELPLFRQLFSAANAYGRVDWPPAFEYRDLSQVGIYDFADRDRHLDGQSIATRRVPIGE